MTTMAERNVNEKTQPLPQKIEIRLAELVQMGEFDRGDVAHCRTSYWAAREDWHRILIDCYDTALERLQQPIGTIR
jgi:hypothetical protein